MKTSINLNTGATSTAVATMLPTAYNVVAAPRLIADWNYNRFTIPTGDQNSNPAFNQQAYGFDIDSFPISAIYEPLRPSTKGIAKARVGQATVCDLYVDQYAPKFYVADPDDVYKYWTSTEVSDGTGSLIVTDTATHNPQPYVQYPAVVKANKLIIKIENTWATPKTYNVKIQTTVGGTWTIVAGSNPTMNNATGILTLYYNGTAWVTTRPTTLVTTPVAGVMFDCTALKGGYDRSGNPTKYINRSNYDFFHRDQTSNPPIVTNGTNSALNVIEISAHMEMDMTSRLISVSDEFDFGETSEIYPIGTITSNQASVTLDNSDLLLNYDNTSSIFYGLTEENVEFNLEYIYTVSGVQHSVQEFKMYSNSWQIDDGGTITVDLEDYSKFLKTIKVPQMMYTDNTVSKIIWRVLDAVGFVDYQIIPPDLTSDNVIPVFWTDGVQTVWEVLNDLAEASQTAIWINSYGKLQIRTRDAAFDSSASPTWHLLGQTVGSNLADIQDLSQTQEFQVNTVNVVYKTTNWRNGEYGAPASAVVWQPDDDVVVVRSSPMVTAISPTDNVLQISMADAITWPYVSKVEVDGEIMQYEGKFFVYFQDNTNYGVAWVTSQDQYDSLNSSTPYEFRYKNAFTGHLLITQRGIWNTDAASHGGNPANWTTRRWLGEGTGSLTTATNVGGFSYNSSISLAGIYTDSNFKGLGDLFWAEHDHAQSSGYNVMGTRFAFPKGRDTQRGGIGFRMSGAAEDGYYVEVTPSSKIPNRGLQNEVMLYSRTNHNWTILHGGVPMALAEDVWYDLDVTIDTAGGQDTISVFLNGVLCAKATTTGATKQPNSGKSSMWAHGATWMLFEYFYGVDKSQITPEESFGFFDLKYGGFRTNSWLRDQVWQRGTRYKRIQKGHWMNAPYRKNVYFFDEFGPYVHEIREFDVKFDPAPVQFSEIYSTNQWYAGVVEYYSSPFEAHFVIANMSRDNAVLAGEDALTYAGTNDTINQVLVVLGRDLEIADDQTVTYKNDLSIRKHGTIDVELTSTWLQSVDMARQVGNWIMNHWGGGTDELQVTIFGNPLLEVGDVVDIDYDEKQMDPATYKYYITSLKNDWSDGLSTDLTLRRVR